MQAAVHACRVGDSSPGRRCGSNSCYHTKEQPWLSVSPSLTSQLHAQGRPAHYIARQTTLHCKLNAMSHHVLLLDQLQLLHPLLGNGVPATIEEGSNTQQFGYRWSGPCMMRCDPWQRHACTSVQSTVGRPACVFTGRNGHAAVQNAPQVHDARGNRARAASQPLDYSQDKANHSPKLLANSEAEGPHRRSMMREAMARGSPPTGERVRNESSSSEKEPLQDGGSGWAGC